MQDQGGVPLAKTIDELLIYIQNHLANPNLGENGRKTILEKQFGMINGESGQRIGGYITKTLTERRGGA